MNSETPHDALDLHQANERTMLAWMRTGISLMMLGFAMARFGLFLEEIAPETSSAAPGMSSFQSQVLGATVVGIGVAINFVGTLRFRTVRHGILRGQVGAPDPTLVYLVGGGLTVIGVVMTVLLVRGLGA